MSLLFYPGVSEAKRSSSFDLVNSLISGVSNATDPRTRERTQRLFKGVVSPIIQGRKFNEAKSFTLEFVDVWAGTGGLTSSLCRQIQVLGASMGFIPRFRVWFVDLEPADPTRFFRAKKMSGAIDSLMFLGDDYRAWLSKARPLPPSNDLRIALVSKLFNNLSHFSVRRLFQEELSLILGKIAAASDLSVYSPAHCLAPSSRGVEVLAISNSRVTLHDGRTFAQLSLSDFYRGLYLALSPNDFVSPLEKGVFLPVRTFNPDCLVTLDGKSVIARLVEHCDYVVIEDADLTPKDLVHHMTRFALHSITVRDVTRALRLTGNYAYIAWSRMVAGSPNFSGEQIW